MKPALYAFSPYLRFKGGGENYFLRILEVVQAYFSLHLIVDPKDLHHLHQQLTIFGIDLKDTAVVKRSIRSQADIRQIVPPDAVFFSVSNGRPLMVDCRARILHQQVIFHRLTQRTAAQRYPGHDWDGLNTEIRSSFSRQDNIFFSSHFICDFMTTNGAWHRLLPGLSTRPSPTFFLIPFREQPSAATSSVSGASNPSNSSRPNLNCSTGFTVLYPRTAAW